MRVPNVECLPYSTDTTALAELLSEREGFVFLDSASASSANQGLDILTCLPEQIIECQSTHPDDTEAFFRSWTAAYLRRRHAVTSEYPFIGGWIGALSYDLGESLVGIRRGFEPQTQAVAFAAYYAWALVIDHTHKQCLWVDDGTDLGSEIRAIKQSLAAILSVPQRAETLDQKPLSLAWTPVADRQHYEINFERIRSYLVAGDCYQINYAQAFRCQLTDSWHAYKTLRTRNAGPYSACLLNSPLADILCFSPELFIEVNGRDVKTRPIKGTASRHRDPQRDQEEADQLLGSSKNRAENVMIVDLLRNDLGRVCEPGSVQTTALCELTSYPTVHHLTSEVVGKLRADQTPISLLEASFPGGSITGAPKKRAMQIIRELEPEPRGIYCGTIFALSNDGQLRSNICIRTISVSMSNATVWGGGGIVWDSTCGSEYQETLQKLSKILSSAD